MPKNPNVAGLPHLEIVHKTARNNNARNPEI